MCSMLSDQRIKENIMDINTKDMMLVNNIRPISFNYTFDTNKHQRYGFIAQDVQAINESLVSNTSDGLLSVNYLDFIPLLTAKVQQLSSENALLKKSLDEMMSTINTKLKEQHDELTQKYDELAQQHGKDCEDIKTSLTKHEETLSQLQQSLTAVKNSLDEQVTNLKGEQFDSSQALLKKINDATTSLSTITNDITTLKDAIKTTSSSTTDMVHKGDLETINTQLLELSGKFTKSNVDILALKEDIDSCVSANDCNVNKIDDLCTTLTAIDTKVKDLSTNMQVVLNMFHLCRA